MKKLKLFAGTAVAVAVAAIVGTVSAAGGPPQFLTFPILMHVGEDGLDHGHFVFSEEAAFPTPLARDLGASDAGPAQFGFGAPAVGLDVDASSGADSYEGETSAASTAGIIVGGANHIYPGNCNASAASNTFGDCAPIAMSSVDGSSWTRRTLPRNWNNTNFGIGFDPALDVDKNGNFYFSYGVAPLSGSYPNAIVVATSTDGITWTKTTPVTFNRNRAFDDKYYMAIDRSNNGATANRIYVSWDRNQGNNQILYIAYSSDHGSTWSAPIKVNDGKTSFERVIGAYPAVDQGTGVVYDSWHDYAKDKIFVDKSSNGGASWGTDVVAATTHTGFGVDIGCVGGRAQGPAHALKVGPSGALYLVYADQVQGRGFDVLFTKSTNGGATWSAPLHLNNDSGGAHQFHPTLSVRSGGSGDVVTVTFYDRRDDPNNCLSSVYSTVSSDGGATWGPNAAVTTAPSNFNGNPNGPGDYSSSTPWANLGAYPFFSDHRSTNGETATGGAFDVYAAQVQ